MLDDLAQFEASYDGGQAPETFQHYQVLRRPDGSLWELGRGAMGVTYKAFDTNLRCHVALKVISTQHLHSEVAGQRFIREARVAAQLRHRNIASVYHLGVDPQGFFYSMEFIDGETLEDLLERVGPLPLEVVLHVGLQTARALAVASRQGLIHRDIKPANLMVLHQDEDGEDRLLVKVIDFGLARSYDPASSNAQLTATGFVGTPLYASPEQLEEKDLDIRSDIYSLGITLWILLTGRPPFEGKMTQVITQHLSGEPPWWQLGDCPEPARALLERMLKKNPDERFQTAVDLRRAIEECLRPWLNEATVSTRRLPSADSGRPPVTAVTTPPPTETDGTDGFGISLRRALHRAPVARDQPPALGKQTAMTAAPESSRRGLRPIFRAGTDAWRRLPLAGRCSVGGLVLVLCATGALFRSAPSRPAAAKPPSPVVAATAAANSTAPAPAAAPAATPPPAAAPVVLPGPEPIASPEAESTWQPEVNAVIAPPESSPSLPPSFLLGRTDEALQISSLDLPAFDEPPTNPAGLAAEAWPASARSLFVPEVPSNQGSGPLNTFVTSASAVPWAVESADEDDEDDDNVQAGGPSVSAKNRPKAATRRTRSRRTTRKPAPRPNFFQKIFGIKPKAK